MPKFNVLPADMKLYSPAEPEGRVFLKGEPWPGDAWSTKPGGEPAGAATGAQAIKDLEALQKQYAALQHQMAGWEHDLAQRARERDEAVAELSVANQRAADAERARQEAVQAAAELTAERDQARQVEAQLRGRITALEAEIAKVDGDKDGKVGGSTRKAAQAAQ